MAKTCTWKEGCTYDVFSKGLCQNHWKRVYGKPIKKSSQKPAIRKAPIGKLRKPIQRRSRKEQDRMRKYIPIMHAFLSLPENKYCKCGINNCRRLANSVHHTEGRAGDLLFDTTKFLPVAINPCHTWIETHPKEAIALGLFRYRVKITTING